MLLSCLRGRLCIEGVVRGKWVSDEMEGVSGSNML
jgi:hypothetical protein